MLKPAEFFEKTLRYVFNHSKNINETLACFTHIPDIEYIVAQIVNSDYQKLYFEAKRDGVSSTVAYLESSSAVVENQQYTQALKTFQSLLSIPHLRAAIVEFYPHDPIIQSLQGERGMALKEAIFEVCHQFIVNRCAPWKAESRGA